MTKWLTKKTLLILLVVVVALIAIFYILPLAVPIILALFTALLLEPTVKWTKEKFQWNRKPAVISVFVFFLILISLLLYFTITQLIGQIIQLTKMLPDYLGKLSDGWTNIQNQLLFSARSMPDEVLDSISKGFDNVLDVVKSSVTDVLSYDHILAILSQIPNFLVSFIVYIIALFLFMLDLTELKKMLFRHFTPETAEKVRFMLSRLNHVIFGFMKAQILVSFIILGASLIGLWIIAPKYAIIMSIVIWIIDVIPILGSIIIVAPWALYQFAIGDASQGTQLTILAVVLLIIRRTVEPKVMGSQIGLSPLATLIAMFIGLKLFGFLGFFIGPLVVIIFTTAKEAGMIKTNFKL